MPRPISQALLHIDQALQDQLITDSGLKLFLDPSYHKEWNASVTARVAALPIKVNTKEQKIRKEEQELAQKLIERLYVPKFDISKYKDTFFEQLKEQLALRGEKELVSARPSKAKKKKAEDLMTQNPKTISEEELIGKAAHLMEKHKITSLFVVDKNLYPIGIIHLHDLLQINVV